MTGSIDPGIEFLERLLTLSERSPDRIRPASAAPNYDALPKAAAIGRLEDQLLAAERIGAVTLKYGRRERKHLIERVTVKDAALLARHLGREPSRIRAADARRRLDECIQDGPPWLEETLEEMSSRWSRGEAAYKLAARDVDASREFLMLLRAIAKDEARGIDARSFALRVTGDTKAFDRHSGRLGSVLARQLNILPDAVWQHIGLERYPHPVHVRGPLRSEDAHGTLTDGRSRPFASFHPEAISSLRLVARPRYILSIENYASFNRYVREIDDDGLVLYTGGFPSAGVVSVLTWIVEHTDATVPLYHWGDIDPGGLRIFRFLEEALARTLRPHLMDKPLAEKNGRIAQPDAALNSIAQSTSAVASLAAWLSKGSDVKHLEQEAIAPAPPPAS